MKKQIVDMMGRVLNTGDLVVPAYCLRQTHRPYLKEPTFIYISSKKGTTYANGGTHTVYNGEYTEDTANIIKVLTSNESLLELQKSLINGYTNYMKRIVNWEDLKRGSVYRLIGGREQLYLGFYGESTDSGVRLGYLFYVTGNSVSIYNTSANDILQRKGSIVFKPLSAVNNERIITFEGTALDAHSMKLVKDIQVSSVVFNRAYTREYSYLGEVYDGRSI